MDGRDDVDIMDGGSDEAEILCVTEGFFFFLMKENQKTDGPWCVAQKVEAE